MSCADTGHTNNIFIESGALNRVAEVVRNYKSQEPLIIADDITKYISRRVNIPEVLVATAPSIKPIGKLSCAMDSPPAFFQLYCLRQASALKNELGTKKTLGHEVREFL